MEDLALLSNLGDVDQGQGRQGALGDKFVPGVALFTLFNVRIAKKPFDELPEISSSGSINSSIQNLSVL